MKLNQIIAVLLVVLLTLCSLYTVSTAGEELNPVEAMQRMNDNNYAERYCCW